MRINAVNSTPSNTSFKSNLLTAYNNEVKINPVDERKLAASLVGLAVITATAVTAAALKKQNANPVQTVKNTAVSMYKKHASKPKPDPAYVILDGKRDKDAVRIYTSFISRQKLKSLETRFKAGEFLGKGKPLDAINENKEMLVRASKHVI